LEIIMAHMLEQYGDMASFASLRQPAWHGLGTILTDEVTTLQMLEAAHLDKWNVRCEEVMLPARSHRNYFATVRTNPFDGGDDVLGVVGERYKVLQNEDLFAFGDNILDGARWETAGAIKNGTVVFGSLALERESIIDKNGVGDKVNTYLLVHTSHDGSLAIQASITPVRVVCQNTLNMAVGAKGKSAKQSFRIRHTATVAGKITAAREALGMAHKYMDEFDIQAQAMFEQFVTADKFFEIVKAAYPEPDADVKGALTKWTTKVDTLFDIWNGPTNVGIKESAWGTYNTLTERLDWYRNPRGGNAESVLAAASGFDAATNAEKNRLLGIVKELAFA
jgi:phage/plasmid-like protein (TIGR03299 family)